MAEGERAALVDRTRFQIAFYGSTKNYAFQFDDLGFEGTSAALNERLKAGDQAGLAATITDEMLDVYSLETSWDGLADALHDKYDGIADRVVMYDATGSWQYDASALERWRSVTERFHKAR